MNTHIALLCLSIFLFTHTRAQKGYNQVSLLAETPVPIHQNIRGFGGYVKGLYGIGKSAQLSFTAGVSVFRSGNSVETLETTTRLIPFLAGYRQNLGSFYIEPQVGYGELGGKINADGDFARPSVGAFFWAMGAGYTFRRLDIGLRFQNARGTEGTSAGLWHNRNFHYTGAYITYNLFSRKKT